MKLPTVDSLVLLQLRCFRDDRGALVPLDVATVVPFSIVRIFWVYDVPANSSRGSHAHKECHQFLVCMVGSVDVDLFDGSSERTIALAEGQGLHVPPGIFATERYATPGSILIVFCDRPYETADYLTDRAVFIAYRRAMSYSATSAVGFAGSSSRRTPDPATRGK
jgi:dTDP-4-dehydrorhamnose 3,5-epimerase-like enzyme